MRKRKCPRNLAGEESADLGLPKIKKISSIKNSKPRKQKNSQPSCELETNKVNGQNNNSVDHNHNSIEPKNSSVDATENQIKSLKNAKPNKIEIDCNWKMLSATIEKSSKSKHISANRKNKKIDENEIWFDDVDEMLLENSNDCSKSTNHLVKPNSFKGLTKTVAMDCEMVGVGIDGVTSMLARTSIVNHFGNCIYDKYVKNLEKVTDFRTRVSGIRAENLNNAEKFSVVQKEVSDILKGRILVGHAISNDLKVLYLSHPKLQIRDTSKFKKFRRIFGGKTPSLRRLTERLLGVQIQDGEHSSIQDAQAAIRLYTLHRKEWESTIGRRKHRIKAKVSAKTSE